MRATTNRWMMPGAPRGFTLVEMLIVVTMVALVAGIAIPRLDTARFGADAAARSVQGQLQQAQRLAVVRQYDVIVGFDATLGRMRIHEDRDNDREVDADERVSFRRIADGVRVTRPPMGLYGLVSQPVVGANLKEFGGLPSIVFRRDGSASTDAEIYLAVSRRVEHFRAIAIVRATGRVTSHRWTGEKWSGEGV